MSRFLPSNYPNMRVAAYLVCFLGCIDLSRGEDNLKIYPTVKGVNFAANDTDAKRLFRDIFVNYIPAERPVIRWNDTTKVDFDPVLIKVLEVYWKDEFLHWNPDNYGGRKQIQAPVEMVWVPDLVLYNNLHRINHARNEIMYAQIDHDGKIQFLFPTIIETSCSINIKYFPIDVQECFVKWASWSYHINQVNLTMRKAWTDLGYYEPNPEFDLVRSEIIRSELPYPHVDQLVPDITQWIVLKRKPLYYAYTIIIPTIIITMVSMIGLFAPTSADGQRREKLEMGLNALLALSMMIMSMTDMMPPNGKNVPLLGLFYMGQFIIVAVAIFTSTFIINLEKQGHYGWPAPEWMKTLFIERLPVYLGMNLSFQKLKSWKNKKFSLVPQGFGRNFYARQNAILQRLQKDRDPDRTTMSLYLAGEGMRVMNEMEEFNINALEKHWIVREWDRICDCIDRLCIYFYVALLSFGLFVCYLLF